MKDDNALYIYLPPEMASYKADLEFFVSTMVRKLHVNRHKGTSKELDIAGLIGAIKTELVELEKAIDAEGQFDPPLEAADVANFAFLIAMTIWHMTREDFEKMRATLNSHKLSGMGRGAVHGNS